MQSPNIKNAKSLPSAAPVIIVGAGPVGLTLSIELSRYGINHLVLTDGVATSSHPKCNTTNARSMEHFRRLGLAKEIRFGGLRGDYPTDVVYTTRLSQPEIARIRFPSPRQAAGLDTSVGIQWQTPEPQHRISQIFLEKILLQHAASQPCSQINFGQQVLEFVEDGDHVLVDVRDRVTGTIKRIRCQWLIGCDGGRSTVRQQAKIEYLGEDNAERAIFGGTMIATYYRSKALQELMNGREGFMYWTLNPEIRSVTVAIDGESRFLTHVQSPDRASAEALDPMDFLPRIAGQAIDVEILSSAIWNAGFRLVAKRFSEGRIVLAGDAAHLFTPTGGFGMNTGIDDVANLAWKLAAEVQGWGGARLVDSYDAERRPIAHRNTMAASEIADIIGDVIIPAAIEGDDEKGAAARASVAGAIASVATEEFQTVGVQLGVRYEHSPIIVSDGSPAPSDTRTRYEATARPGSRLPHFALPDGSSIYDKLGTFFTLLDLSGTANAAESAMAYAAVRNVPLTHLALPQNAGAQVLEAAFVIVRPDQHVAWRGNILPEDFASLWDRILGAKQ